MIGRVQLVRCTVCLFALEIFYWYFVLFAFTFYLHFWCILLLYSERQNCIVWYMNIVKVTMDARVYSFPLFCLWKVLAYMIACAVKFECKNNFKIYSVLDVSFEFASFDRNFCNWRFDGNDEAFLVSFFQIPSDVYVFSKYEKPTMYVQMWMIHLAFLCLLAWEYGMPTMLGCIFEIQVYPCHFLVTFYDVLLLA